MRAWRSFFNHFQTNLKQNLISMAAVAEHPLQHDRFPVDKTEVTLKHAPGLLSLPQQQQCTVNSMDILVSRADSIKSVSAFLHLPKDYPREAPEGRPRTAAILLSGAGGGVVGPSSIYLSIADKVASLGNGIPVMRLDYRYPARNRYCVPDVTAAMDYLQNDLSISRFVLVGWSYGGAPVFTVGGQDERVVGCATVASQTAETTGIRDVAKRGVPVMLLHGTGDCTLLPSFSESLNEKYRSSSRGGMSELKLFDGGDHALSRNALKAEQLLCDFIMRQAGEEIGVSEQHSVVNRPLIDQNERMENMEKGGDLQGESVK